MDISHEQYFYTKVETNWIGAACAQTEETTGSVCKRLKENLGCQTHWPVRQAQRSASKQSEADRACHATSGYGS